MKTQKTHDETQTQLANKTLKRKTTHSRANYNRNTIRPGKSKENIELNSQPKLNFKRKDVDMVIVDEEQQLVNLQLTKIETIKQNKTCNRKTSNGKATQGIKTKLKSKCFQDKYKAPIITRLPNKLKNNYMNREIEFIGFNMPKELYRQKIEADTFNKVVKIQKVFRGYLARRTDPLRKLKPNEQIKEQRLMNKLDKVKSFNFDNLYQEQQTEGNERSAVIPNKKLDEAKGDLNFFYLFKNSEYNHIVQELFYNEKETIMNHLKTLKTVIEQPKMTKEAPTQSHKGILKGHKSVSPIKSIDDVL